MTASLTFDENERLIRLIDCSAYFGQVFPALITCDAVQAPVGEKITRKKKEATEKDASQAEKVVQQQEK